MEWRGDESAEEASERLVEEASLILEINASRASLAEGVAAQLRVRAGQRAPGAAGTGYEGDHAAATVGMLASAAERLSFDLEARQALGRALLVEDDDLAAEIVRRHGAPCVKPNPDPNPTVATYDR